MPRVTPSALDAGATDPDGDDLTYAASGLPAGLSIDTASGQISGTIAFSAAAGSPYTVAITVRDGRTVDATDSFAWTVTAPADTSPPPPPTALTTAVSTVAVRLTWTASTEAGVGYEVYRSANGGHSRS